MLKKTILIISVIFICCISLLAFSSCTSASTLKFVFATDLHIVSNDIFTADNIDSYTSVDKMIHLSDAIFNTVADNIIKSRTKFLFLGGDLTENGDLLSHQACIKTLNRLRAAGVNVFVINGNHDIAQTLSATTKITATEFSELYKDFGYGEALSTCPGTLSYATNINEKYTLIAIDNIPYETTESYKEEFSSNHRNWVNAAVYASRQSNRTPIIIAHKPLLQHFPKITEAFMDRGYYNTCKVFAKDLAVKNCNIAFTGHMHQQDLKNVTSSNNKVFTDVLTSSTAFFPSSYRTVTFKSKKIAIDTKKIQSINSKYISSFVSDDIKLAVKNDYRNYCLNHFNNGIETMLSGIAKPNGKIGRMNFGGDLQILMDILIPEVLDKIMNNPLYIKDENNNISLERIVSKYNIDIPITNYKSVAHLATHYVAALTAGDENIADGIENEILKLAIKSLFYYINEQSINIKNALPDYDAIFIDLDKLFSEGLLECYESNFIPTLLALASNITSNNIVNGILSSIQNSFEELASFESAINLYTNNHLSGIFIYFNSRDIKIDNLVDAFFDKYVSDLMYDTAQSDNKVTIII